MVSPSPLDIHSLVRFPLSHSLYLFQVTLLLGNFQLFHKLNSAWLKISLKLSSRLLLLVPNTQRFIQTTPPSSLNLFSLRLVDHQTAVLDYILSDISSFPLPSTPIFNPSTGLLSLLKHLFLSPHSHEYKLPSSLPVNALLNGLVSIRVLLNLHKASRVKNQIALRLLQIISRLHLIRKTLILTIA